MQQLTINVNDNFNVNIEPRWTLMKVIRDVLGLKGINVVALLMIVALVKY